MERCYSSTLHQASPSLRDSKSRSRGNSGRDRPLQTRFHQQIAQAVQRDEWHLHNSQFVGKRLQCRNVPFLICVTALLHLAPSSVSTASCDVETTTQVVVPLVPNEPDAKYVVFGQSGRHPLPTIGGTLSNPYIHIEQQVTDQDTWAKVYFPGVDNSTTNFRLTFEAYLSKGNNYFLGGDYVLRTAEGPTSIAFLRFRDSAYTPDQICEGGSSWMHAGVPEALSVDECFRCCCNFGPTIFGRFFAIELSYDILSGNVSFSIDGSAPCRTAGRPGMIPNHIKLGTWLGWWTGHVLRVRSIEYHFTRTTCQAALPGPITYKRPSDVCVSACRTIRVSGAGYTACNGNFIVLRPDHPDYHVHRQFYDESRGQWGNSNGCLIDYQCTDFTSSQVGGCAWGFGHRDHHRYLVRSNEMCPPQTGWIVRPSWGASPAPTMECVNVQSVCEQPQQVRHFSSPGSSSLSLSAGLYYKVVIAGAGGGEGYHSLGGRGGLTEVLLTTVNQIEITVDVGQGGVGNHWSGSARGLFNTMGGGAAAGGTKWCGSGGGASSISVSGSTSGECPTCGLIATAGGGGGGGDGGSGGDGGGWEGGSGGPKGCGGGLEPAREGAEGGKGGNQTAGGSGGKFDRASTSPAYSGTNCVDTWCGPSMDGARGSRGLGGAGRFGVQFNYLSCYAVVLL